MTEKEKYIILLEKLFQGNTTEAENEILNSLSDKEMEEIFLDYSQSKWDSCSNTIDQSKAERMQNEIMSRIASVDFMAKKKHTKIKSISLKIASIAAVALLFLFAGYMISDRQQEERYFEIVAENGQKSFVSLPDGSCINLNAGSRIRYSTHFNRKNRNIYLEGEAYFNVAKNKDIPFVVEANGLNVTALGTKFNIKAYENEQIVTATLIEGRIKAEAGTLAEEITPNRKVCYNRYLNTLTVEGVEDTGTATAWMEDKIIFTGETLEEISQMLIRMYNIDIVFDDEECKSIRYNGLIRNNSLDNILNLISSAAPVKYSIEGNTVILGSEKE